MAVERAPSERLGNYHFALEGEPRHQPLYLNFVLAQLRSNPGVKRVLDVGCGDGNFTASLADAGYQMLGLDGNAEIISAATKSYPAVRFAQASAYDDFAGAFDDELFDAVVSIEVIEHLYSPREFVRRVHDALRPNGLFIVTTPYWGYLKNLLLALTNRTDRALTSLWEGGHIKHWSFSTLRELLEQNGFQYVAFYGAGRPIPYCWMGMAIAARKRVG